MSRTAIRKGRAVVVSMAAAGSALAAAQPVSAAAGGGGSSSICDAAGAPSTIAEPHVIHAAVFACIPPQVLALYCSL